MNEHHHNFHRYGSEERISPDGQIYWRYRCSICGGNTFWFSPIMPRVENNSYSENPQTILKGNIMPQKYLAAFIVGAASSSAVGLIVGKLANTFLPTPSFGRTVGVAVIGAAAGALVGIAMENQVNDIIDAVHAQDEILENN